ncbi:MAG: HD domain-containing protein [Cytophagaceae bacterium]|nr:HD domain-containing protein [Cytophagaceae bacterium]
MERNKINFTVETVFGLYAAYGAEEYVGEPVSLLEHMGQAAQLAEAEGYDEEVVLAAFLHDVGHLLPQQTGENMDGYGHLSHEKIGAAYLRQNGFSEKITRLVLMHVQAKRYLCFRFSEYYQKLSEASRQTLVFQGGVMSEDEATAYQQAPYFTLSLKMREWDEAAKETELPLPKLGKYKILAVRHLENQGS